MPPINFAHLRALEALPHLHRDPFDRMMIAQAIAEGIPIATADRCFAALRRQSLLVAATPRAASRSRAVAARSTPPSAVSATR